MVVTLGNRQRKTSQSSETDNSKLQNTQVVIVETTETSWLKIDREAESGEKLSSVKVKSSNQTEI